MKISAVIWVKDEVEMLARSVAQLLRLGVDTVSIMDDRSTDGTEIVIDTLVTAMPNVYRCPPLDTLDDDLTMDGPVFGPVIARDRPDWLLVSDPDEFWIARSGSLKSAQVLKTHDVVVIDRLNAALPPGAPVRAQYETDAALRRLPLLLARKPLGREQMAEDPSARWIEHAIQPRIMVRPDLIESFGLGLHKVGEATQDLKRAKAQEIVIAHLPFSSFARFERKVANTEKLLARFGPQHSGTRAWHWKRWLELASEGRLREEYDRQFFPEDLLARMIEAGDVADATTLFAMRQQEAAARRTRKPEA